MPRKRKSERARKTGLARKDPPMDYTDKPNDWRDLEDGKCLKTRSALYYTRLTRLSIYVAVFFEVSEPW